MTVVLVTTIDTGNQVWVQLPSGADVGDVIEVHCLASPDANVVPPASETLRGSTGDFEDVGTLSGISFRKISATDWRVVGGP